MPIIPTRGAAPTGGALQTSALTLGQLPGMRQQRIGLVMTRLADLENERNKILQSLARLREDKKAKGAERDADRAALGGQIGTAAAVIAAPFTGGASLALLPAMAQTGTGIAQLASGDPSGAQNIQGFAPNPFLSSPKTTGGNVNDAFSDPALPPVKDAFQFGSN